MFKESERSTFGYWFAHWCAFNMTALNLKVWKPRFLLHDIEKPWLMLLWKDYPKVQEWHRKHSRHHLEYNGNRDRDCLAMVIDWECSRFTKESAQLNAYDTLLLEMKKHPEEAIFLRYCVHPILKKLGLINK